MENLTLTRQLFGFSLHRHIHRHLRDHFIPNVGNQHVPRVLHHRALFLYSLLLVLVKLAVLVSPLLLPYDFADTSAITTDNIVSLTNQSRTDYGLPALNISPQLAVAAVNKARDMMKSGYFAHFSADGISPWFWIQQAGYEYAFAGENLAIRFTTAEGVAAAWLQSAAHRANILSKNFTEIGVAVVTDQFGAEGIVTLVVQMFGAPALGVAFAKTETAAPQALRVANLKLDTGPEVSAAVAPEITFPLKGSFVKQSAFRVIGNGELGGNIQIFIDDRFRGEAPVLADASFELVLSGEEALAEGAHVMYARAVNTAGEASGKSAEIGFIIDTQPPMIFENEFSFLPVSGETGAYQVSVGVSEDSVRTLVSVGRDSAELARIQGTLWTGKIKLLNSSLGESLPIQIYAQDLAGNESKTRLGRLSEDDVSGVFNFVSAERIEPKQAMSLFGGLFTIPDFPGFAQKFYLSFVVFLSSASLLNIAVKRHVHHPKTIAAATGVMMLAMVLFAI